ncbi:MAG: GntR family transcriptional regulator [Desulfofustis sp.]|jgi:DNA-binding GntR family transcriptional regulator|nr:GntR family transcriptional regulator [Desulfofustis sp.]
MADGKNTKNTLQKVVKAIEHDIIFGRLHPRERLIEDELIERFAVKRHTIRTALNKLEQMGIIIRRRNRGAIVRDFTNLEVDQIYEMRELLQRFAAEKIPLPAKWELISELTAIHEAHSQAVKDNDLPRVYDLNNHFHDTLFSACGNPYLVESINHLSWLAHNIRSYRIGDPENLERARQEHRQMIEALEKGNREEFVRLCLDHILPSKLAYIESRPAV